MTTLKDKTVKTRKEHVCFGCGMKHPKGSKMRVITQADFYGIGSMHYCGKCSEALDKLEYGDTFNQGGLWDEWEENQRIMAPRERIAAWDDEQAKILEGA